MSKMKKTINYCGKDGTGYYRCFSKSKKCVKRRGYKDIFRVVIRECDNVEDNIKDHTVDNIYWSWWDNEKNEFLFTQQNKVDAIISYPYIIAIAEKQGEGKLLPVVIEEI